MSTDRTKVMNTPLGDCVDCSFFATNECTGETYCSLNWTETDPDWSCDDFTEDGEYAD